MTGFFDEDDEPPDPHIPPLPCRSHQDTHLFDEPEDLTNDRINADVLHTHFLYKAIAMALLPSPTKRFFLPLDVMVLETSCSTSENRTVVAPVQSKMAPEEDNDSAVRTSGQEALENGQVPSISSLLPLRAMSRRNEDEDEIEPSNVQFHPTFKQAVLLLRAGRLFQTVYAGAQGCPSTIQEGPTAIDPDLHFAVSGGQTRGELPENFQYYTARASYSEVMLARAMDNLTPLLSGLSILPFLPTALPSIPAFPGALLLIKLVFGNGLVASELRLCHWPQLVPFEPTGPGPPSQVNKRMRFTACTYPLSDHKKDTLTPARCRALPLPFSISLTVQGVRTAVITSGPTSTKKPRGLPAVAEMMEEHDKMDAVPADFSRKSQVRLH